MSGWRRYSSATSMRSTSSAGSGEVLSDNRGRWSTIVIATDGGCIATIQPSTTSRIIAASCRGCAARIRARTKGKAQPFIG
jgi:hypothetical protein